MMEIDFLPLGLRKSARWSLRHQRAIIAAAIVASAAIGLHAVHQLQTRSSRADVVRPVTTRTPGISHDNPQSGVQSKHHVHLAFPPDRSLQGTPLGAVLADVHGLENDSLVIASAEADSAGGDTVVYLNGFASTEIAVGTLLGRLGASSTVGNVRLTDSRVVQFNGRAMREFTITFTFRDGRTRK